MAAAVIHAAFGDGCNLYEVLGVERSASAKDLTKAYRRLALRYVRPLARFSVARWHVLHPVG